MSNHSKLITSANAREILEANEAVKSGSAEHKRMMENCGNGWLISLYSSRTPRGGPS